MPVPRCCPPAPATLHALALKIGPMQARLYLFNSVDPDARSAASTACSARWRVTIQMRAAEAVRCLGAKRGANGIC